MKKIVPDPPRNLITTSHYTLHNNLPPQDALVIAGLAPTKPDTNSPLN